MFSIGLDLGSTFSKIVILSNNKIAGYKILPTAGNYQKITSELLKIAQEEGIDTSLNNNVNVQITLTGYGSNILTDVKKVSDITCQGIGVNSIFPNARTIIDIGGQSTKVIKTDESGRVLNFNISEKCAAGSGRFLQIVARIMGISFSDIGELSLKSTKNIDFSTSCAVFAESEVISRIAEGIAKEDILAAIHRSMALKIVSLSRSIGINNDVIITGGGAMDKGLLNELSHNLGIRLMVPEIPQITAAIGASRIYNK